jgi:hypothetical protein
MKHLFPILVLVLGMPGMLPAQSNAFFPEQLVVTASALNLRETPDVRGRKLATLPRGTVVDFIEAHNNGEFVQVDSTYAPWLRVRYQGQLGYAFGAHLTGTVNLFFEGEITDALPAGLNWYGVYRRDSFSDEIRRVNVRLENAWNEMFGATVKILKTNQAQPSKFLLASLAPLRTGYAGPLGLYEVRDMYLTDGLYPGVQLSIHAGQEAGDTTTNKPTYGLAVSGCATMQDMYARITNYRLLLLDYAAQPAQVQDLTRWVQPEAPDVNPSVSLLWFGDIDYDGRPDAVLQDCPYEVGCRASLFLSSKARNGEYLRKVCEHFWPGD